jgi:cobalt-zinc-cadmium efflux system outer membrane protein
LRRYERTDDYGVVASFSIPFGGSNNNQGNIAQANAAILMNQAEMDAFEIQLESQLFVEFQNYQHSIHLRELLAQNIIPKLEKALKETQKIYESGKYSYLDWRDVQNELLNAQSKLLNTQYKAHINLLSIERITGSVINN